ncbi:MAG: hypothetical protein GY842_13345 [bacterium]|nr:hypothetical protein [bacterium]
MRRSGIVIVLIALMVTPAVVAVAPPGMLVRAADDEVNPLPRHRTSWERQHPVPPIPLEQFTQRTPPTGAVYCPPEYAPNEGMLIRWGAYNSVLTELTVTVTTLDPDAMVYIVATVAQGDSAAVTLDGAGADMSQVEFITYTSDSVWMRDYGPRFIFEDGARAIVNHTYNRSFRAYDNAFPGILGTLWGETVYDIPLVHGGGNFHLFANGDAFMSSLVLGENPSLSEQDVKDLYQDYQNLDLTIYPGFPTGFDSTQHIDMWMMPLGDDSVVIGEYDVGTGQPYTISENAVTDLSGRGYTIHRTPGWNDGGTHYTYTNAVILNDLLLIPAFGAPYLTEDAAAQAVFEGALPGHTVVPVDCSDIIHAAGAIHCVVMHVPAYANPFPSVTVLTPDGGESWASGQAVDITWQATDDVGVTGIDLYCSTNGGSSYPHLIATGEVNDGAYAWTAPSMWTDRYRIKVVAHDADLNMGEDESDADFTVGRAPVLAHAFTLDVDPGWTVEGDWEHGVPTGGGTHNYDPQSGYTGANVYGYNLEGDYPRNMSETEYLTSIPLDCQGLSAVELRFWRWLGVESSEPEFDHATVEVSTDGQAWQPTWEAAGADIGDTEWTQMVLDISSVVDDHATVYLRWGMGPTDGSVTFPGWNVDDIEIWGASPCDLSGDGLVDPADHAFFERCHAGPGVGVPNLLDYDCAACDLSGDGDVDLADFAVLQSCSAPAP